MSEDKQTFIEISGYIDCRFNLSGKISGKDLENKKTSFDFYEMLLKDLMYRLEIYEVDDDSINFYEVEEKIHHFNEYVRFVTDSLIKLIEAKKLPIKEVDFTEYEENGRVEGYDYVATLNLTFEQFLEEED